MRGTNHSKSHLLATLLLGAILVLVVLAAIVQPVSATTIDKTFSSTDDTSVNGTMPYRNPGHRDYQGGIYGFNVYNIVDLETLCYIVIEFQGTVFSSHHEGIHEITYTLPGKDTKTGRVYVAHSRNVLGSITGTKFTYFFDDWDATGLTGSTMISTNYTLISVTDCDNAVPTKTQPITLVGPMSARCLYLSYTYTICSLHRWENNLHADMDDTGLWIINLNRSGYESTLDIYRNSVLWHTTTGIDDVIVTAPPTVNNVTITSRAGEKYVIDAPPPDGHDLTAPTTLSIRSTQTGALIPGARAIVLDSQTGTTLINNTLASGSGTFRLEKSHTLRYLASATADDYALLSPIQFDTGDSGVSIVLWMTPTSAPTPPENTTEGKTMLYGYLITQGSSQPIPGATVTLSGIGSTTTSSTGSYLFNNIDPGTYSISASAPNHDPITESVTAEITATPHNLALQGHYTLRVTVKDADSLKTLTNATTISLSDGQEHNDQNPTSFAIDYGTYTITAAAEGYYPLAQNQYIDKVGETVATILMTPKTPPPPTQPPKEMPNYPPHNVRFHCIDDYGLPLPNVTISAEYLETTSPWSWFTDLLGIPSTVNINATTLRGTTGSDGSITFSMIESVRYAITAHDPASNLTVDFTLYPQETQYTIQFRTRPPAPAETYPLYELEAVPLDGDTQVSLNLAYRDRDNGTTSLSFWVKDAAGELVYTSAPALKLMGWTNTSYTVQNQPTSYTWGFDATHTTSGDISAARSITLHGSGRLVDLGFEDDFWYYLLSAVWIVALGAIFSGSRVRFGAIIIPLIGGGIPTLIGWLPLATIPLIGILTFIGVFVYMRKSEYKLYR